MTHLNPSSWPLPLRFWGKTRRDDARAFHPALLHGLDVAACAQVLLERNPGWLTRMAGLAGLSSEPFKALIVFLIALHDIGKLSDGFGGLRPDLMMRLLGRCPRPGAGYDRRTFLRHDRFGLHAWERYLLPTLHEDGFFSTLEADWADLDELLQILMRPVFGHHGEPVPLDPLDSLEVRSQFGDPLVQQALKETVRALRRLLLPGGNPLPSGWALDPDAAEASLHTLSWPLAGLVTAADWLGSNEDWFPFFAPRCSINDASALDALLTDYWHAHASPQAQHAIAQANLTQALPSSRETLLDIFDEPTWVATPLQALAERLDLGSGPQLVIIEEPTGGGKSEAAMIIAQRLMIQGSAEGLYVALPTMATANALFDRVASIHTRMFSPDSTPSLTLAHSAARLRGALDALRANTLNARGAHDSASAARRWLEDSRKKALLNQVGVGTIDQALVAILPLRHQCLRVCGLLGKVIVIDEVHAADTYVSGLLDTLLTLHAQLGGCAILLSATLPLDQRAALTDAFARGLGVRVREEGASALAYPLLTHLTADGQVTRYTFPARATSCRRVEVTLIHTREHAHNHIVSASRAGRCACWIRNTVGDAMEAYEELVACLGADRVILFHSRFALGDRTLIEQQLLTRIGKKSSAAMRRGLVIIATQVMEQSLDVDVDEMVTDLAPIDLLIQRAGRLRRHPRTLDGDPLSPDAADRRGSPRLLVLAPEAEPDPDDGWFKRLFHGGAFVYPQHGRLWLTAQWLGAHGGFSIPRDARDMIESVYGASLDQIPEGLQQRECEAEGNERCDRSMALRNQLKIGRGYQRVDNIWEDDVDTPTRLGEPTVTLRLARVLEDGSLDPWFGHRASFASTYTAWELSQVRIRRQSIDGEHPDDAARIADLQDRMLDQGAGVVTVLLHPDADGLTWRGRAARGGQDVALRYDDRLGLRITRSLLT